MNLVKHSYKSDCIFLLKDLTGILEEITIEEKENLIRQGISYSEVISKEAFPSVENVNIFKDMLENSDERMAYYVGKISEEIYRKKGNDLIIVSLARGGTPYGILVRKYLKFKYNIDIPHYSISIIRGRGIDYNALKYILKNHPNGKMQFIDGWTGKGSIIKELYNSIDIFNKEYGMEIDDSLAVIADPAKLCRIYGTREDIIIPNCCLNSTVSGLISRTVLNEKFIGKDDFHGAKTLSYLQNEDLSQYFIDKISAKFTKEDIYFEKLEDIDLNYSKKIVEEISDIYNVKNINNIKLSIGETARVLLRRDPRFILVSDINDKNLVNIIHLAKEKDVEIKIYKESGYRAIALINEGEI